jgi:hypothetical protein
MIDVILPGGGDFQNRFDGEANFSIVTDFAPK